MILPRPPHKFHIHRPLPLGYAFDCHWPLPRPLGTPSVTLMILYIKEEACGMLTLSKRDTVFWPLLSYQPLSCPEKLPNRLT